jgi:glycosyltransferase involved in cell wall biosynthesis
VYYQPKNSKIREYLFYQKMFWSRLIWCVRASRYKTVFFQRSLFPDFYDQKGNPLERLLRAYSRNIIADFFDADYALNAELIHGVIQQCDTVTVVNNFLRNYFEKFHQQVVLNDLSIDTSRYIQKSDFTLSNPVRLFWTGSIPNLLHLKKMLPALRRVHASYPIKLVIVGRSKGDIQDDFVEHHLWSDQTFNQLITGCDIAIYPAYQADDFTQGKVAYKCLEYACCKLPMIASPYGLSSRFTHEDALVVITEEEWVEALLCLIRNQKLREQLGENAFRKVVQYHDTNSTYRNFVKILTARWQA